jgi:hypothetical protein
MTVMIMQALPTGFRAFVNSELNCRAPSLSCFLHAIRSNPFRSLGNVPSLPLWLSFLYRGNPNRIREVICFSALANIR